MKNITVLMNSHILGGAERSIVDQMNLLPQGKKYYIPVRKAEDLSQTDLYRFLSEKEAGKIFALEVGDSFLAGSRKGGLLNKFLLILSIFRLAKQLRDSIDFENDLLWANGNKVGLAAFALGRRYYDQVKLVWHFRDFPFKTMAIWNWINKKPLKNVCFVGNSKSVTAELGKHLNNMTVKNAYNYLIPPATDFPAREAVKTIGTASMLAPWKGIHEVVLFVGLYQNKLKEIGIEKVLIYGDQIYEGRDQGYKEDLVTLMKSFDTDLIEFKGVASPREIYESIDLLIHSSIQPEPFGRILIEAYQHQIPVLSTGLGGAAELIFENRKQRYFPADHQGLFEKIRKITVDSDLRKELQSKGLKQAKKINHQAQDQLLSITSLYASS